MKTVPFYANHKDNNHCMVAIYRSLFHYFWGQKITWNEMDAFVGYTNRRAAWTLAPLTKLAAMGLDIHMIEPFDYRRYAREGRTYLDSVYPPEKAAWLLAHSNIAHIQPSIPDFLKAVRWEKRRASLQDIDNMLTLGRLIFVTLNARVLNGLAGHAEHAEHAVLIIDREGGDYIVHDPGPPPQANRRISRHKLWQAMGGDTHTAEVTGFRLATKAGRRLDQYVVDQKPRLSRAFAAKLITDGNVTVNGAPQKPGYKLHAADDVQIAYDESILDTIPDINLPILYEDDDCLVLNKPAGVLTHAQGAFNPEATVASFLQRRSGELKGERAGVVHRLDRATSGVLIGAKTARAMTFLQRQFAERTVQKTYVAVVEGRLPQPEAVIDMPIARNPKAPATFRVAAGGKPAVTHYRVMQQGQHCSLVELRPQTGRTHQLRVHLARLGHPIVGDPLYGHGRYGDRLFLHARDLTIALPGGGQKTFRAPLPPIFSRKVAG